MATQTHIGLKVFDKGNTDDPRVTPANFTSVGIPIKASRGIPNKAVLIGSKAELVARYGDIHKTYNGVLAISLMYDNMKPYSAEVYVSRLVNLAGGDVAANASLTSNSTKIVIAPSASAITFAVGQGITVTAGSASDERTVTIVGTVTPSGGAATTVTETYTNLKVDSFVQAINNGLGVYTKSQLVRVEHFNGILPTVAAVQTIPSGGLSLTNTGAAITVNAGQFGFDDPGSWGNDYGILVSITNNNPDQRDITVYKKIAGEWIQQGAVITGLNINNQFSKIALESNYINIPSVTGAGLLNPTSGVVQLSGGADAATWQANDADLIGTQSAQTGFYAFDATKITNLLIIESLSNAYNVAETLDFYLEANKADCLGHINVNATKTALIAQGWAALLRTKSWVCTYLGFQGVDDNFGGVREIPAIASFYGRGFIRKMFDSTGYPSVSPAGYASAITGAKYITTQQLSDADLLYVTKTLGINAIQDLAGVGIILRTSRTMSTDNVQYDIHRRRSINFLTNSFQNSLGWVEQEPNTPDTRRRFVLAQYFFLQDLYNAGMFKKDAGFEGAVKIQCDEQNNPESQVAQRILQCDTTVAIVDTIETATLNLMSKDRVLTVNS